MKHFSENFLHFLWQWRRFDAQNLLSTQGETLEIIHPGERNSHAGPDFFNARIKIADTLWAGNVEIHVSASEWLEHGHQHDPAYDNVILHVVFEEDEPISRSNGERIPGLTLQGRIPPKISETWQRLEHERAWIPCESFIKNVPDIIRLNWLDRLLVERLEQKTEAISRSLEQTQNHWEEAFYQAMARSFGLKVNPEPFESLARSIPLLLLAKHKNKLFQIEALLFGQAGWLSGPFEESYPSELAKEYKHLRLKYELTPLAPAQWKFLRLRPANFPTIRMAQFAALIHRSAHLFSVILETDSLRELEHLLDAEVAEYWNTHYVLDKSSVKKRKSPGRDFVHLLIINTIVPFLFHYGKARSREDLQKRALRLLEELPAESNTLIDGWKSQGVEAIHAYQSQALIQLKTRYCDAKRCLECAIGNSILK